MNARRGGEAGIVPLASGEAEGSGTAAVPGASSEARGGASDPGGSGVGWSSAGVEVGVIVVGAGVGFVARPGILIGSLSGSF